MAANIASGVTQRYIIGPNNTRSALPETIADKANTETTATNTNTNTNTNANTDTKVKESKTQPPVNTKPQNTKDSLKFAGVQKTFNIMSVIPNSDITNPEISGDKQTSELIDRLNALQFAKRTLSEVQSIVKDIKSNYRTESNDNFAPLNDDALRARYDASMQIRELIDGAKYKGKNVFLPGFFGDDITLNSARLNLRNLNLRDELSINIFSNNVARLSDEIESNVKTLQGKLDKIQENKWLSMEQLSGVQLEPKSVNESAKALSATPSLTAALQAASASGASSGASVASVASDSKADSNATTDSSATTADSTNNIESNSQDSTESSTDSTQNINSNAQPQSANTGEGGTTSSNPAADNATTTNDSTNIADNTQTTQTTQTTESSAQTDSTTTSNTESNTQTDSTTATNTQTSTQADSQTKEDTTNAQNTQTTQSSNPDSNTTAQNAAQSAQTTDSTNNTAVGIVSGTDKDKVVDLYM